MTLIQVTQQLPSTQLGAKKLYERYITRGKR